MFFITSTAEAPCVVRSLSTLYTRRSTCITEVRFSPVISNSFRISASGCRTMLPRSRSSWARVSATETTCGLYPMKLMVTFIGTKGNCSIMKSPLVRTMVPPSRLSPRSAWIDTVANSAGLFVDASITLPNTLPLVGMAPRTPAGGCAKAQAPMPQKKRGRKWWSMRMQMTGRGKGTRTFPLVQDG